jgi:hypothetical protein
LPCGTDVAVTRQELAEIISLEALKKAAQRGVLAVLARGTYSYNSLPDKWRRLVDAAYSNGHPTVDWLAETAARDAALRAERLRQRVAARVEVDQAEVRALEEATDSVRARGYARLCAWLRLMAAADRRTCVEWFGVESKERLYNICIAAMGAEWDAGLLAGQRIGKIRPLLNKMADYEAHGPLAVVSRKEAYNDHARKADEHERRLLLALATRSGRRLYANEVWAAHRSALAGRITVVDTETGETLAPRRELSLTTVKRVMRSPEFAARLAKMTASSLEYRTLHEPHKKRAKAQWALSKATMDDQKLPFKLLDGKQAWCYFIFDVCSGAVIGHAVGVEKDRALFKAAITDMMLNEALDGRLPLEFEVERHISSSFKDDLLKKGEFFESVRWCLGGNPREKRAENFIRAMRNGHQRKHEGFQYRPFARLAANRENSDLKDVKMPFGEIKSIAEQCIEEYNHSPHPDQGRFAGMTRMQVLAGRPNPNATPVKWAEHIRLVGERTTVTLRGNKDLTLRGNLYQLPDPALVGRLNGLEVEVYWSPRLLESRVWVYQDGRLLCECEPAPLFSEARAEWTEADAAAYLTQQAYTTQFNEMVKADVAAMRRIEVLPAEPPAPPPQPDWVQVDYAKLKDLFD